MIVAFVVFTVLIAQSGLNRASENFGSRSLSVVSASAAVTLWPANAMTIALIFWRRREPPSIEILAGMIGLLAVLLVVAIASYKGWCSFQAGSVVLAIGVILCSGVVMHGAISQLGNKLRRTMKRE